MIPNLPPGAVQNSGAVKVESNLLRQDRKPRSAPGFLQQL
jgi:hypothetical protein